MSRRALCQRSRSEPDVLETADQPSTNEPRPLPPNRVQALLGITCAIAVAANLGLPELHAGTAIQLLFVVVGFRLARVVHRCSSETDWRVPMVLGLAARAIPTILLMIVLLAAHRTLTGGLGDGEALALVGAATFTADIIPFVTGASYAAIDHLWAVALVGQVAVLAPWLLTVGRHRLCPRDRSMLLFAVAGLLTVIRLLFLATAGAGSSLPSGTGTWLNPPDPSWSGAIAAWTSLDALLVGLAIGTLPLANLHRRPTTRLVAPAVGGLAILLVFPSVGSPIVDLGLRMTLAAVFGGIVLSAEAISGLPDWLNATLTNAWWHRLGSRTFGLYLWHLPFAYGLTGDHPYEWQGSFAFVLVIALTLAAATTTYRSIEIPAQMALASLASRWYRADAILLPSPQPQRGKWVRWDDISLDRLPIPTRRRSRTTRSATGSRHPDSEHGPLGRRLWQLGDREIDLRPGRRRRPGAGRSETDDVVEVSDVDHGDHSAATG